MASLNKLVTTKGRGLDLAAYALLLFASVNLNGLFLLLLGTQGLLSPLILCLVLTLWIRYARPRAVTGTYALFVAFIGSYLIFASFANLSSSSFNETVFWINLATLLLVSGLYFFLLVRTDAELESFLRVFKGFLIASCILVLLTPILGDYLDYVAASDRASGLFVNPNEAGIAALLSLVLIYAYPPRRKFMSFLQAAIAFSALALTFSKTGILTLTLLMALVLLQKRSLWLSCLTIIIFALAALALLYISESDLVHLTYDQRVRIADILSIFGGEISDQTTTGRTDLWAVGIQRILEQLPWGGGIGTFHALEGTRRTVMYPDDSTRIMFGNWLGVHNAYLMVLGEAGLFPFLLLMCFFLRLFTNAFKVPERTIAVPFGIIICMDMMASHGSLGFRLVDVALAVMMAIAERPSLMSAQERKFSMLSSSAYPRSRAQETIFSTGIQE
ncbi:O-antigen ligase family protein [Microvirga sp. CF3062]|uniref:O-antigen ligase family protein n=1 Tax=Microvirga sp. CF3062 TaxID=3110182 RepID=UPI002E78B96B|nr:O-antigen ligase family protein [Microvirga sp. CF3062]MEE1658407.1 O-antigen ligase family protein [Microvirga sp. CF3062]